MESGKVVSWKENGFKTINNAIFYSFTILVITLLTRKIFGILNRNEHENFNPEDLLSDMVIPLKCIKYKRFKSLRGKYHTAIVGITNIPSVEEWQPVLLFLNKKSGANQGNEISKDSLKLLSYIQVHDLCKRPPHSTLELCNLLPDVQFKIVICGGDGSANWVLSAIDEVKIKIEPKVAVIPVGTGNDLAQYLNWGSGFDSQTDTLENYLAEIRSAEEVTIDRWSVSVNKQKNYFNWGNRKKELSFTNYFSLGCDALLSLQFHKQRQHKPGLFFNRSINKLFYLGYGAKDVIEQQCCNLNQSLELWLDGEKVELPYLEAILCLNIPNWGGGCAVWDYFAESATCSKCDPADKKLEVMGFTSSFHMAQIQVNLAQPIRLGQASDIVIVLKSKIPAQADGEPWEQEPCEIVISHKHQVTMLRRSNKNDSDDESTILQVET